MTRGSGRQHLGSSIIPPKPICTKGQDASSGTRKHPGKTWSCSIKAQKTTEFKPVPIPSLPTAHPHPGLSSPYYQPMGNCYRAQKPEEFPAPAATDKYIQNNLFWWGFNYALWEITTERERNTLTHEEMWVWTIALLRRKGTRNWNIMFVHLLVKDTEGKIVA